MSLRILLPCLLLVLAAPVGHGFAAGEEYMGVDEIRRGMRGVGRTVFQGTRIDSFQAEVLGVLRDVFGPKSDIILARLSGGPLKETGVIAGMSGSPVYIDGRLIGAVGYSIGAFAEAPIAGITPIGEMLSVMDRADTQSDSVYGASGSWSPRRVRTADTDDGALRPVAVPLLMSGFATSVVADHREDLLGLGLFPVQAGGGMDPSLPKGPFEPGAALGVQLIRGDFSVTGIGTLTHRVGDRVVGFGHPMLWGGNTAMPMTSAYIHEIVPSQLLSFKLGVASDPMGTIVQDRAPGIAGVVGASAKMMPTRVEVRSGTQSQTYRMEVMRSRELGPILVRMAVASSLFSAEKVMGEATVHARTQIDLSGFDPIEVVDTYAGPRGLGLAVQGMTHPLAQLLQNPFEAAHIESVAFSIEVEDQVRLARISGIRLGRTHYDAGDTIDVTVLLRPHLGKEARLNARLSIPPRIKEGRLSVRVSNARTHRSQEAKRIPAKYVARDLADLVRQLRDPARNDELVVELSSTDPGVTVDGYEMAGLPASVLQALGEVRESGVVQSVRQNVLARVRLPAPYVLSGSQSATVSVGKEAGVVFTGKGRKGNENGPRRGN